MSLIPVPSVGARSAGFAIVGVAAPCGQRSMTAMFPSSFERCFSIRQEIGADLLRLALDGSIVILQSRTRAENESGGVMKSKVALVTGASSGIGEATAERLAAAGYTVYGTSRRGARAGKRAFEMLPLDVNRDESVEAVVSEVVRRSGRIDLLVNNAGFSVGLAGDEESSIAQAQAIFDTNFFGTVRMTRAVVPHMRRQAAGRIINIGSVLGFVPMPYMAVYSASKHAIEGYSNSLDHELRTRGVRVAIIEPGVTKTQFEANLLEPDSKVDEYRDVRAAVNKRWQEVMAAGEHPAAVAEVVLKAANAARPRLRYPVGRVATFQLLRRLAPGLVDAAIRRDLRLDAPAVASSAAKQ
jgi:short-subunit dehydrogenase